MTKNKVKNDAETKRPSKQRRIENMEKKEKHIDASNVDGSFYTTAKQLDAEFKLVDAKKNLKDGVHAVIKAAMDLDNRVTTFVEAIPSTTLDNVHACVQSINAGAESFQHLVDAADVARAYVASVGGKASDKHVQQLKKKVLLLMHPFATGIKATKLVVCGEATYRTRLNDRMIPFPSDLRACDPVYKYECESSNTEGPICLGFASAAPDRKVNWYCAWFHCCGDVDVRASVVPNVTDVILNSISSMP